MAAKKQPDTQPGELNRRITLLVPATTQDNAGGPGEYTEGDTCWAKIESTYGQNVFQGQYVSESTHKIRIRYRDGVTPSYRIAYGDRSFNILYIADPGEGHVWLDLYAQEVL